MSSYYDDVESSKMADNTWKKGSEETKMFGSGTGNNPTNPFGTANTSGFGNGSATAGSGSGIFSGSVLTTTNSSVFGGSGTLATGTSPLFGGGANPGNSSANPNTVFGGSAFGSPNFSTPATSQLANTTITSSTFVSSGQPNLSTFGGIGSQGGNTFGNAPSQPSGTFVSSGTQGGLTFGSTMPVGGTSSTFGAAGTQGGPALGVAKPQSSGSVFGGISTTFGGAGTQGGTSLGGAGAQGGTSFGGIDTQGGTTFGGTGTQGGTTFGGAGTQGGSSLGGAGTQGGTTFGGTGTQGGTTFGGAGTQGGNTFGGTGTQVGTTFGGAGTQGGTTFGDAGTQGGTTFGGSGTQGGTTFGGTGTQGGTTFGGTGTQGGTTFGGTGIQGGTTFGVTGTQGGTAFGGTGAQGGTTFRGAGTQGGTTFGGTGAQGGTTFRDAGKQGGNSQTAPIFDTASDRTIGTTGNVFGVQSRSETPSETAKLFRGGKQQNSDTSTDPIRQPGGAGLFSNTQHQTGSPKISRTVHNEAVSGDTEAAEKRTPLRRRTSVIQGEDIESRVAIICKNVPSKLNNQNVLKRHFSQFGVVTRIYPNSRKQQATVHFANHESAKNAKFKGRYLSSKLEPMQIFWSAYTKPGTSPGVDKGLSPSNRGSSQSDVNDELQGMLGTSDIQRESFKRITRTEDKPTRPRSRSPAPIQSVASPKPRSTSPAMIKSHMTLNSLAGSVANTAGDKYEILQKRDELLRESLGLHMKKQTELADAKTLKASCQDMCPEKERYQRQYQRRVHVYEMIPGTDQVDHARAVKEYSRSSADQDLPLPNELRPPEVLEKTMEYLLNNIVDLGEDGKWGDWYDFLWNRTRSIRKEITQLQLCDLSAVRLVEKCARFHIYCSERLCEEDMMIFDEKINNENLTKSLQTLKELYEDLGSKDGQKCPNEAEFRAYIVLMNLNEGDVLREMQTLPEEVRESSKIKFVVSVHSALNCNNYIRFFKLVRQADFLSACIMHRYFTQVRTRALFTMSKAYKNNPLTLQELERLLSFESSTEAKLFCVHHGLEVKDDSVLVDKHRLVEPETPFSACRAIKVIESKQQTCVGWVINGSVLSPNDLIVPSMSFDSDNRFMASSLPVPDVPEAKSGTTVKQEPGVHAEPVSGNRTVLPPTKTAFSNEAVKEIAKELFLDVIKEFSVNMSTTFVKAINVYLDKAGDICDSVTDEVLAEESRAVAEDSLTELLSVQKEVEARRKAEMARQRALAAEDVCEELVRELVNQEVDEIAHAENREVQIQLREQSKLRSSDVLSADLLSEVLEEETEAVAIETHKVEVVDRLRELEENCQAIQWMMVARFFNKWKNAYAARVRLQRSMVTFPPTPSMKSMEQQVSELLPDSEGLLQHSLHLGKKAKLTLLSPGQVLDVQARISHSLQLQKYWQRVRRERAWAPLDVAQLLAPQLYKHQPRTEKNRHQRHNYGRGCSLYWKLLVCLPEKLQDGVTTNLCNWLCTKLKSGAVPSSRHPHISELLALYHSETSPGCKTYVCIRTIKKVLGVQDRDVLVSECYLQAASALIFVLRQIPREEEEHQEYFTLESSRLRLLLEEINKLGTRLPLLILVPFAYDATELVYGLELKSLEHEGLLNGTPLITWIDKGVEHQSASKKLMRSLAQLAGSQPEVTVPGQQTLREFIEDVIHKEFYTVIYQDLAKRTKEGLMHQEASSLVSLYNSVLEHMAELVSDGELSDIPWPIPEFVHSCPELPAVDWNERHHLCGLQDAVLNLSLPDFVCGGGDVGSESEGVEDWQTAVEDVWAYVDAVAESGDTTSALLYSRVSMLLRESRERFEDQCWERLGAAGSLPLHTNIPWTEVIVACVHHRLSSLDTYVQAKDLGFDKAANLPVYYYSEKLSKFGPPAEWLEAVREDNRQEDQSLNETLIRSVKRKHSDQTHSHRSPKYRQIDSTSDQSYSESEKNHSKIDLDPDSEDVQVSKNLEDSVVKAIAVEKRKSRQFDDYLEKVLKAGDSLELGSTESFDISFTSLELQVPLFRRLSAPATTFFSPGLSSKSISRSDENPITPKPFYSPGLSRDTDPPRPKSAGANRKDSADHLSIIEKLDILNSSLSSQKQANKLFEMKLQSFIDMDKF